MIRARIRVDGRLAAVCRRFGGRRQAGSGMARSRARARLRAIPRPTPGKMQGDPACRAGEPSGQGEEPSPEGLGGHDLLAQADARGPAGQVVGHHLDRQPGAVGGEAAGRHVVQPDAVLEVAYLILDLGVAAMVCLQFQGLPVPVGDEAVITVGGEESQLRTGRRLTLEGGVGGFGENPFPKPWHEVEQLITQAVQEDIQDNLGQADLRPIDLYLSAFGPALRVISEHWGTERESNNPMDAATKFYVLAKDATENDTMLFDEANLLARAIGVRLEKNDSDMKRVVGFKADKVSLLSARDRLAARNIGEDINPGSTLDTVHMAIALTDRRNTLDAQQWLTQHLHDPQEAQFRATLEALIRTTKPGHDDYPAQRNLWQSLYGEEAPQPAVAQPALL